MHVGQDSVIVIVCRLSVGKSSTGECCHMGSANSAPGTIILLPRFWALFASAAIVSSCALRRLVSSDMSILCGVGHRIDISELHVFGFGIALIKRRRVLA